MTNKIVALVVCAILSVFSLAAADAKAEPKTEKKDTLKAIPADLQLDIAKAQAKLQVIERNAEAVTADLWNRIRQTNEYKQLERQRDEAQATVAKLVARARSVSGAPEKCFVDLDIKWVESVRQGETTIVAPCTLEAAPAPEVKK